VGTGVTVGVDRLGVVVMGMKEKVRRNMSKAACASAPADMAAVTPARG
jgi:hypothetical protein